MFFDGVSKGLHKSLESVVNPLKEVKNGVSKKVLGPKLDLVAHAEELLAMKEFLVFYKKELTALVARLKKEKVAATKLTVLKKVFLTVSDEETFDEFVKELFSHIEHIKHVYKDGYQVTAFENTLPKVIKSKKWTVAEKVPVVVGVEEMEMALHAAKKELTGSLPGFLLTTLSGEQSLKQAFKQTKKVLDEIHDAKIVLHMSLNRSLKKYNKVLETLKKESKNLESLLLREKKALPTEKKSFAKKISDAKKRLKTLNSTLPVLEKEHNEANASLEKNTTKEMETLSAYAKEYSAYQTKLFQRVAVNKKQTITLEKKKSPATAGKDTTYRGVELVLKKPYNQTEKFIKEAEKAIAHHNKFMDSHSLSLGKTIAEHNHKEKDILAKEYCVKDHQEFLHNQTVLHKVATIFMTFINRYNKQHTTLSKKAISTLLELERTDKKLYTTHTKSLKSIQEFYETTTSSEKKRLESLKKTVAHNRKHIWDLVRLQAIFGYEKNALQASKETATYPLYASILQSTSKSLSKHLKVVGPHKELILNATKMSAVELADKELSLAVKATAATKKSYETVHKTHDQQELLYGLVEHYCEEQSHLLEDTKELVNGYTKSLKKAKKTQKRYEGLAKSSLKKIKNSPMVKMFYS